MFLPQAVHVPDVLFPTPNQMEIRLEGALVFRATLKGSTSAAKDTKIEFTEEPCAPVRLGYPHGPKDAQFVPAGAKRKTLVIKIAGKTTGMLADISASPDSMPTSDDPRAPLASSFNNASNLMANGVYDRTADWLLTCEGAGGVQVTGNGRFRLTAKTAPLTVRLRTDYYRNHEGYFLWDKTQPLWRRPVAGWCSWMAHLQEVTEQNVRDAAEFFAKNLKGYGYDVIQIDDGYQRVLQHKNDALVEPFSNYWSKPNEKFPSGLRTLAADITKLGMTPGIWVGYYLPATLKSKKGYVTDPDGTPHKGDWVGYAMNGLDVEAREEAYLGSIRQLRRDGWRYFKIDTLRHVLYDSYRQVPEYWKAKGQSMEDAFRALLAETKRIVGRDTYLLACWGTMPELAGIPDGARIGEDVGPDVASMRRAAKYISQFHHLNNVVWRNDPDYMCLRVPVEQARAWATLTSMAGGHVMVSDPVSAYDADRVDVLRRVGPPLFLRPLNAIQKDPDQEFMLLNARKNGEAWTVASRFGWTALTARDLDLADIGLDPKSSYLVFDFWKSAFLGVHTGTAPLEALNEGACQVLSFRPVAPRPQILGTDRHLGQGAYELEAIRWYQNVLSGKMRCTQDRKWSLWVYVPEGYTLQRSAGGEVTQEGPVVKITFPESEALLDWWLAFKKSKPVR